jgi:glycerol-3-phosphate acyltransferase PlsX
VANNSVISLDAMSGDLGAEIVVRAAKACLDRHTGLALILVGAEEELRDLVTRIVGDEPRLSIVNATEVVGMSEAPADAIGGTVHMLDLGANTVSDPDQLFQFAVMGSIVTSDIRDMERPRVALLNIGVEDTKGHDTVRAAAAKLNQSGLNYVGFIEGNEIFSGKADVVVTDGFTGNVALKTMEGTSGLIRHYVRRAFTRNLFTRLQAVLTGPVLRSLNDRMDSRNYNGASLVGLNGIVIKSHGSADSYAFQHAIETALVEVENQVPKQIGNLLAQETE